MITAVIAQKGGCGKTTISAHLAGWHTLAGRETMLIDADKQSSATTWASVREELNLPTPETVQQFGRSLKRAAQGLARRYDHIVIDAPGGDPVSIIGALQVADIAIAPFQTAEMDIWTVNDLADMIADARASNNRLKVFAALNRAPTHPSGIAIKRAAEALKTIDEFTLMNAVVKERSSIRDCVPKGYLITEWRSPTDKKARSEMSAVFLEAYGEPPPQP